MAAVAQDGLGGGSYYSSGVAGGKSYPYALPIDDVLNNKVAFSLQIKEAPDLNGGQEANLAQQTNQKVLQEANDTSGIADAIISRLESTNSQRYYTGEEAQTQVGNLKTVVEDMNALSDALNRLAGYPITQLATRYNNELKRLKDCVEMKLLKELADDINAAAKSGQNWNGVGLKSQETKTIKQGQSLGVVTGEQNGGTEYVTTKMTASRTVTQQTGNYTTSYIEYQYTIYHWKYINYWSIFKLDFWPFTIGDDDLPKLVQRFNNAGINPYQYIGR